MFDVQFPKSCPNLEFKSIWFSVLLQPSRWQLLVSVPSPSQVALPSDTHSPKLCPNFVPSTVRFFVTLQPSLWQLPVSVPSTSHVASLFDIQFPKSWLLGSIAPSNSVFVWVISFVQVYLYSSPCTQVASFILSPFSQLCPNLLSTSTCVSVSMQPSCWQLLVSVPSTSQVALSSDTQSPKLCPNLESTIVRVSVSLQPSRWQLPVSVPSTSQVASLFDVQFPKSWLLGFIVPS